MSGTLGTYLRVNCCEVVNPCRISAYIGSGVTGHRPAPRWTTNGCGPCCNPTDMSASYTYPGDPGEPVPAPWYDATIPASGEFFGAQFTDTGATTKYSDDMRTRTVSLVIDLVSSTQRGAIFGYQWLCQALNGGLYPRAGQCQSVDLEMSTYCTSDCEAARIIPRARLTVLPLMDTETQPYPCDAGVRVTVTYEAPTPWLYRAGAVVSTPNSWATASQMDCRLDVGVATAPDFFQTALNAYCAPTVLPTLDLPTLTPCVCEPMFRTLECVKTTAIPPWTEAAVKIILTTGANDIVSPQIIIWPDEFDSPCPSDPTANIDFWANTCPIAVANPIVIPANTIMIIDGVTGRITMEHQGCVVNGSGNLFGFGGTPWIHPTLACNAFNTQFCIGIAIDGFLACNPVTVDLAVTVEIWEREL